MNDWNATHLRRIALVALFLVGLFETVSAVATTVEDLCADADPCVVDTDVAVESESVLDLGDRDLVIADGGTLDVGSGSMVINAAAVTIAAGGEISARGSGSTNGGTVEINADSIDVVGDIDVSGAEGQLRLNADGAITVSGELSCRGLAQDQNGGGLTIDAASIVMSGLVFGIGGREDSFGADVEFAASGNITIEGDITLNASNGGTLAVDAGVGANAGNIVVASTATIDIAGVSLGGLGGSIDMTASGDGITTGTIRFDGSVIGGGSSGGEENGGGDGGCFSLDAVGDVSLGDPTTSVSMVGGAPDGTGGTIELTSDNGSIVVEAPIDISAQGVEGAGGAFDIDSFSTVRIEASIDARGGDGGEIAAFSASAGLIVESGVVIDASAREAGSGGSICLDTALVDSAFGAEAIIRGDIIANGGGTGGSGGSVDITGRDLARITGTITANGGANGGIGGGINLASINGTVFVDGDIEAIGRGESGGAIGVDAEAIEVNGNIDVSGNGASVNDTMIGLRAPGTILVVGDLSAQGGPGSGGLIEVHADGDVTVAGTISSDGSAEPGGTVDIRGADVLLCGFSAEPLLCMGETGRVQTLGPLGTNRLTARGEAIVFGEMAGDNTGRNIVVVRDSDDAVIVGSNVPAIIVEVDPNLPPLVGCGNGIEEEGETCDDGNTRDGDGCSASCQVENLVLGDVNGDEEVTTEDVRDLITEIFDNDGTLLGDVSRGGFPGAPGADANQDGVMSAADIVEVIDLLGAP